MSNVNWKYFQITNQEHLLFIKDRLESRDRAIEAAIALRDEVGAKEVYQYNTGAVAAFCFYGSKVDLDMTIWKKVKDGHMPRAKTDLAKKVKELPRIENANDVCKFYGFGGEMVLGEQTGRGFKMHSSYIRGVKGSDFWCISVPYNEEFEKEVSESLIELKEWEMLKKLDELK